MTTQTKSDLLCWTRPRHTAFVNDTVRRENRIILDPSQEDISPFSFPMTGGVIPFNNALNFSVE